MMADKNSSWQGIDRRTALRGISTVGGITSGLGMIGGVVAEESKNDLDEIAKKAHEANAERKRLKRKYSLPKQVRKAVKNHAGDLLTEIANQGFIESGNVEVLPTGAIRPDKTVLKPGETFRGVGISTSLSGEVNTALIMVSKHTPNHHVAIYVQPEAEKSYSFVTPKKGGESTFLRSSDDTVDVGTMDDECYTQTSCTDSLCHYDEGTVCITQYYPKRYVQCCPHMGCGVIGESSCLDGCSCCNENCPP